MRTSKRKKRPKRPEARSLKIQPKYRLNQWSTSVVPEIKLCGNWLEKLGFSVEGRVIVHTSKELIAIRPQGPEESTS